MTLFRKVFQNESKPATGEEGLDEDALRDAFLKTSGERVLPLDPFAVAETSGPADTVDARAPSEEVAEAHQPEQPEEEDAAPSDLAETVSEPSLDDAEAEIASVLAQTGFASDASSSEANAAPAPVSQPDDQIEDQLEREMTATVSYEPSENAALQEMPGEADPASEEPSDVVAFAKKQLERAEGPPVPADNGNPPLDLSSAGQGAAVPAPTAGRAGRRAGRVKTRLLGFNRANPGAQDPISANEGATAAPQSGKFPVGWLVVVEGPGVGHAFSIFSGASMIGRGDDQMIKLDFGDTSISRHNHAAIAYDEEQNKFYIGHGGKSNIIRRNARPVLSTEELHDADLIRIGETTLRFVALCGADFQWDITDRDDATDV